MNDTREFLEKDITLLETDKRYKIEFIKMSLSLFIFKLIKK